MSSAVVFALAGMLCSPPPKDPFQSPEGPVPSTDRRVPPPNAPSQAANNPTTPTDGLLRADERERLRARSRAGKAVAITGFVFDGLGLATLVILAMPAAIAAEVAEDRTETNTEGFFSPSDEDLLARAERRRAFARTTALVGAGTLGGGLMFTGAGLGVWLPAKRELDDDRRAGMQLSLGGVRGRF